MSLGVRMKERSRFKSEKGDQVVPHSLITSDKSSFATERGSSLLYLYFIPLENTASHDVIGLLFCPANNRQQSHV